MAGQISGNDCTGNNQGTGRNQVRGYSNPQNRPRSRPRLSLEEGNAQIAIKVQKIEDEEDSETNQALGPMITPQFPWLFPPLFATKPVNIL